MRTRRHSGATLVHRTMGRWAAKPLCCLDVRAQLPVGALLQSSQVHSCSPSDREPLENNVRVSVPCVTVSMGCLQLLSSFVPFFFR
jgi:hypothetical protein